MKRYLTHYILLFLSLFLFASCQEEVELTTLKAVSFTATPSSSANTVSLTAAKDNQAVLTVSWSKVAYPVQAPVSYTLQFDVPADTLGSKAWANAVSIEVGEDLITKSLLGKDLNTLAVNLGLTPNENGTLVVRVQSYLDRAVYSKAIALNVTPYKVFTGYPSLWVAGDYQGWNVSVAPKLVSVNSDDIYEGYLYIPAGGTNEFKLYAQADWGPMSYGDGGAGNVVVANYAGGNFKAPSDGYYLFSVNLKTMKYILIKTTWGLIGGATPGGWSADTPLVYNPASQTWSVTADMKADGSFKFRANKEWQLDFGVEASGKLNYANHPWRAYVDQPQLTVPQDGNYTITLDLHEPGNYTYKIKKN
ncbi:MAG: SusE domain-containing protein [Flectobacillus sp.]|nr:SusE domain-containing protein [Flectobacillus sp.]